MKLKFRPGWDVAMVREVRTAFPKLSFHVDCNSAYRLDDAPIFEALDEFNLAMIEQPFGPRRFVGSRPIAKTDSHANLSG